MLTTIRVKRFKAIHDSGNVSLGPLNVFIGRNGSGKSSLIEFIELISNTFEHDLQAAALPFRRGRDVIQAWSVRSGGEAVLSVDFDPGDVSAGDRVHYELGIAAPGDGESLEISTERLSVGSTDALEDVIRTTDGVRLYRVPPTRRATLAKRQRKVAPSATVGERPGSDWIRISDSSTPAITHVDQLFSKGGHAFRTWLEGFVALRLYPLAVAEFAPRRRRRGSKGLDPAGYQTAELLAALSDDERAAVLDKLRFVTAGFSALVSYEPGAPGDQRYFYLKEASGKRTIEIPAWVLSEGTRRLTSILSLAVQDTPPPLLAIEEVENGFDPWTLRFVLEELVACSERGTQILLTTHSPHLMNMLPREVFHFVSRSEQGAQFSRIADEAATDRMLSAMGVGDAYAGNLLGRQS